MSVELDNLRVDHIGSLSRPQSLLDVHKLADAGQVTAGELRDAEDTAIREVVAAQVAIGFPVINDGEFRRRNFQDSFAASVTGYEPSASAGFYASTFRDGMDREGRVAHGLAIPGPAVITRRAAANRLTVTRNLPLEEYRFVASLTQTPVKATLIGPDRVAQRFDWQNSIDIYAGLDDFESHVASLQRGMVTEMITAGCRYIQIDAPGYTAYVDSPSLASMRARGEDTAENLRRSIDADNAVIDGLDHDTTFGIHLCRGNERVVDPVTDKIVPQWHREGPYDEIAEQLFAGLHHKRFLLEYDSERAGGFEPLRFVPKDKIVVLGLVTTKSTDVESTEILLRRIDEACKFISLEQLAISPQCGFASGAGLTVPEDVQWRKLEAVLETAQKIWG
jgi:5-methyltetrahydropteroyltriglutamate--homocysteine methyltransferase